MFTKFLITTLFILIILGNSAISLNAVHAADDFDVSRLSADGQIAYRSLIKANRFEDAIVGFAGTVSEYAKDLDILLKEKEADAAFKSILKNGTLSARLYALCGLFYADHDAFQKEIAGYENSEQTVSLLSGCIMSEEKVSRIAQSDASNVAVISQTETLEDFLKTNPGSYVIDIAHGGYPATFRHFAEKLKDRTY
ncbi:MAG: hypothetical protein R2747_14150 [Pyrinomonadaceae bacterium]